MDGARKFIQKCKKDFIFIVISGTPWIFCELAKKALDFDNYYSTNLLSFNKNNKLKGITGHKHGFEKDRIMIQILQFCGYELNHSIAIGDSENDFLMLNKAELGILVGIDLRLSKSINVLNDRVIKLKTIDFDEILLIIHNEFPYFFKNNLKF